MSDPHALTVRLQALDGQWETCGVDRYAGVWPENFQCTSDAWGSATASFVLRRRPDALYPDLTPFTPVEVEIAGAVRWAGRIKETPTREGSDGSITVTCEGWQYHLDDDVYQPLLVHANLSDFVDQRTIFADGFSGDLTYHKAYGVISMDGGSITMQIPNGTVVAASTGVAVTLDTRPFTTRGGWGVGGIKRAVVAWDSANNTGTNTKFYVIGHDFANWISGAANRLDFITSAATNAASGVTSGTVATPKRYVTLLFHNQTGYTAAVDVWFRWKSVLLVADTAYESGNASILKADQVIKHALLSATTQLSTDQSRISAGTWTIPDFAPMDLRTPRESIQAVNAYENFETKVDEQRRMVFRARASAPLYEIGEWSGANFEDASATGDEIYNRIFAQGTDAAGSGVTQEVYTAAPFGPSPSGTIPNSGFEANTTGWTFVTSGTGGTITRDTGQFHTGAASGLLTSDSLGVSQVYTTITGLVVGQVYRVSMWIRRKATTNGQTQFVFQYTPGAYDASSTRGVNFPGAGLDADWTLNTWIQASITFLAEQTSHIVAVTNNGNVAATGVINIDDLVIETSRKTVLDRRFMQRSKILPVSAASTGNTLARIGNLYLAQHEVTPFRGSLTVVGEGGVRKVLGGGSVHPAQFLQDTGQMLRCSHRMNPDTGAWGRDGTIASVTYDHNTLTSQITLDDERAGFETLLSRLSVVVAGDR